MALLMIAGCAPGAAPPTPTRPPAAPTKAAEPTRAPAAPTKAAEPTKPASAQPTPAPVKKVDFPEKGKAITLIVPWAAGGGTDATARAVAPLLEKDLGVPVQVVNKAGAGGQVGLTEFVRTKADGYTIGFGVLPNVITIALDPRRQAIFTSKDFVPLALLAEDSSTLWVKGDSPFKSMKDVVDEAKANPSKVKLGTSGILSTGHIQTLRLERLTGAKFRIVHFDGGPAYKAATLGGHVDVASGLVNDVVPLVKDGQARVLAIMDKQESSFYPGVKTAESLGYSLAGATSYGISVPAGTPREVVQILAEAAKKAAADGSFKARMEQSGVATRFLGPEEFARYWDDMETMLKPLMPDLMKEES